MRPKLKMLAVLSTIPFAVIINLLRIIITAALSYFVSLSVLNMLIHELTGTITFFIALALFIALCELLQRRFLLQPAASTTRRSGDNSTGGDTDSLRPVKQSWVAALLGAALLIPTAYLSTNVTSQLENPLSKKLSSVDTQLAGYRIDVSQGVGFYKDPGADVEISRIYSAAQSPPIELYVGFKARQQADKRLKSPRLGFPYGWNYVWIEPARVVVREGNIPIKANWMLTQNGQHRVLVLYWFHVGNDSVSGEFERRWRQIRNVLIFRRSDGAVVRLATPVSNSDNVEEAKKRLAKFAAELYPSLLAVLPI
jgi:EpsI family protein